MPTEEVFSAPDANRVDGVVISTKPLSYAGSIIEGMEFHFENGKVTKASEDGNGIIFDSIEIGKYDEGDVQVNATVLVHGFVRKDRLTFADDLKANDLIHVVNQ